MKRSILIRRFFKLPAKGIQNKNSKNHKLFLGFKLVRLLVFGLLLFAGQTVFAASPGNVSGNLSLWLKADEGTFQVNDGTSAATTTGQSVKSWRDKALDVLASDNQYYGGGAAIDWPEYNLDSTNFNEGITFDGNYDNDFSDGLSLGSNHIFSTNAGMEIISVVSPDDAAPSGQTGGGGVIYDFGGQGTDNYLLSHNTAFTMFNTARDHDGGTTIPAPPFGTGPVLVSGRVDFGTIQYASHNGKDAASTAVTISQLTGVEIRESSTYLLDSLWGPPSIGRQSKGDRFSAADERIFFGDINEVIVYNNLLSDADRQKVYSYLALKYGITLDQSTAQDYVASDGTMMWEAATASGFNNDIFGVGRDDAAHLGQIKSKSENNADAVLTILAEGEATGDVNSSVGNGDVGDFVDIADLEFLTVANNDGGASWTATDAPNGLQILTRQWRAQETGEVGTLQLDFDVADADFNIPALLAATVYYFIYDSNDDGSLADETPIAMTNPVGNTWRISGLDLNDGVEFTLATADPTLVTVDDFRVEMAAVADLLSGAYFGIDDGSGPGGSGPDGGPALNAGLIEALSSLDPQSQVGVVRWETLAERGTEGFYVERKLDRKWMRINGEMLPGLITAPLGGEYFVVDTGVSAKESHRYRLIEQEVWGNQRMYGPWNIRLGQAERLAAATQESAQGESARASKNKEKGKNRKKQAALGAKGVEGDHWRKWRRLGDGYAGRARCAPPVENAVVTARKEKRRKKRTSVLSRAKQTTELDGVRLDVTEAALYRVGIDDLVQTTGRSASSWIKDLMKGRGMSALSSGGEARKYYYDEGEQALYFTGEPYRNRVTDRNVYQIGRGRGARMSVVAGSGPVAGAVGQFQDTVRFEKDNYFLTWIFRDPEADIGVWDFIQPPYVPSRDFTVMLADVMPGSGVLRAYIVGANDRAYGPDHRVTLSLNGEPLPGFVEFDGFNAAVVEAPFDSTLLSPDADGMSELRVTLHGEALNGASKSLVVLDSLEIEYPRGLRMRDGNLAVHSLDPGVATVEGLSGSDVRVVEAPGTANAKWREDLTVEAVGDGTWKVSFVAPEGGDFVVSAEPLTPGVEPDRGSSLTSKKNAAEYVIIAPRSLGSGAEALAEYRSGLFSTKVVWLQDIYDEFSFGRVDANAIGAFLDNTRARWGQAPEYVVLIGRGTLDHRDVLGRGESLIPLQMVVTPWGLGGSDRRYASDNSGELRHTLGRIAALTDDEVVAYVEKLRAYETQSGEMSWSWHGVLVADNADSAGDFPANTEILGDAIELYGYSTQRLYHPRDAVRELLLLGLGTGSYSYFNYDGHGARTRLGAENYLQVADVAGLGNGERLPVFAAFTCVVGDSSQPGTLSLADALVLQADGGAVAAFGPTALSLDIDAQKLNRHFIHALMGDGLGVGAAGRAALEAGRIDVLFPFMLDIYQTAGDPAVKIVH